MKTLEEQKELLKSIPTKLLIEQLWGDENYVLIYPFPIEYIAEIINKPSEDVKKYSFEIISVKILNILSLENNNFVNNNQFKLFLKNLANIGVIYVVIQICLFKDE
jgi:hypothetical protein